MTRRRRGKSSGLQLWGAVEAVFDRCSLSLEGQQERNSQQLIPQAVKGVCIYIYIHMYIYIYTYIYICVYTYVHVCVYVCVHVYASMLYELRGLQIRGGDAGEDGGEVRGEVGTW